MGWSSWNNFHVHINEQIIKAQADAMVSSGLYDAGYRFINIDDGYFGGRDSLGKLFPNKDKFPSGMRALSDYIHGKGLNGVGIYGHVKQDCDQFFKEWNYDFLKVDWCGGKVQKLLFLHMVLWC